MVEAAQTVGAQFASRGMKPQYFRSSGGHGIHIYLFWKDEQDAYSVREALREALAASRFTVGTQGVAAGQTEAFPKQNEVSPERPGSMWVLPLAGKSVPLDPDTLEPLPKSSVIGREWPQSEPVPVRERPIIERAALTELDTNTTEIQRALAAIPNQGDASLDYDAWRNLIFAIHHATGGSAEGLALAHEFSSRSEKYDPEFLNERVWPYVRSERGALITARTMFDTARKHGWEEDIASQFDDLSAGEQSPASASSGAGAQEHPSTTTAPAGNRFRVITHAEFRKRRAPQWIVRGVLPRAELVLIVGQPGSGKSFVALDLGAAVALGIDWRGLKTKPARVVYVAAEGASGFRLRVDAYARHHDLLELPIGIIPDGPNLLSKDDARDLILALREFGSVSLAIVDTLAQVMPGGDENSGEDMGRVLAHCKAIHQQTGATVLLVHHVGKDATRGARGWSGILGAADAELTVEQNNAGDREIRVSKMKDGRDGMAYPFRLMVIPIDVDEEGNTIDSCVVEHLDEGRPARINAEKLGAVEKIVWKAVNDLALLGDTKVPIGSVIAEAVTHLPCDPEKKDKRREHAQRALLSLQAKGYVRVTNNAVTLPHRPHSAPVGLSGGSTS